MQQQEILERLTRLVELKKECLDVIEDLNCHNPNDKYDYKFARTYAEDITFNEQFVEDGIRLLEGFLTKINKKYDELTKRLKEFK